MKNALFAIRWAPRATALLALVLLVGCGGGAGSKATVTGKVTYKSGPVTGGSISFVGANDRSGGGMIKADGTYTATDVPMGAVKVTVIPIPAGMGVTAAPPGTPVIAEDVSRGKPMTLPQKYAKADTSGVSFTISKKNETLDIALPD